jgi:hypothetical protein
VCFVRINPALLFLISFSNVSPVAAETMVETYMKHTTDEQVRPFIDDALKKIHTVNCEKDIPCAAATPEEFTNPPISIEEGRAAIGHGGASAMAVWCGLDGNRALLPMIGYGKHHEKMTDRNLMLMTIIHGSFAGFQIKTLKSQGDCPEGLRNSLDNELVKLPH